MRLRYEEMRRIQNRLVGKHRRTGDKRFLGIAFGPALKDGKRDPKRPMAVQFIVSEKVSEVTAPRKKGSKKRKQVLAAKHRVPKEVTVRLRRGDKLVTRKLPTDVIRIGTFVPTGGIIEGVNVDPVTSGAVIRWGTPASRRFGLVTAGHGFGSAGLVSVRIRNRNFAGTFVSRAPDSVPVDAAIVEVLEADLKKIPGLMPGAGDPPVRLRSRDQIAIDVSDNEAGTSFRLPRHIAFDAFSFRPGPIKLGPLLKPVSDVLLVQSTASLAFEQGTSGSAWKFNAPDVSAAMQFGAEPPKFEVGAGQALVTVLTWVKDELGSTGFKVMAVF